MHDAFSMVCAALFAAGGYQAAGFLPFLVARHRLRLRVEASRVTVVGLDLEAMFVAGWVCFGVVGACLAAPWSGAWLGALVAFGVYASFRVRISVTPEGSVMTRAVAFVVPWSRTRSARPPTAFVDGWGDFMDPEALHLGWHDGPSLELAWGDASSEDALERWAEAFDAAVAPLGRW